MADDKKELFSALCNAQAELEGAKKDSTNPHFKSKYADLESVVSAIKPVAAKHGLGYIQVFHEFESGVALETIILHGSGQSISNGVLRIPATKQDAQGYGSAITYARRYSLQAAFCIAPEDDDGNAASSKKDTPQIQTKADLSNEAANDTEARIKAKLETLTTIEAVESWEKTAKPTINTLPPTQKAKAETAIRCHKDMILEIEEKEWREKLNPR